MSFSITVLGTSSAIPTSKRFPTAHILSAGEQPFLIDCGEGTQMQIRKYGIRIAKINHIFLSHLHGDHLFGLFGLLSTYDLLDRKNDLHIHANIDFAEILNMYNKFFSHKPKYKIIHDIFSHENAEVIISNNNIEVTSFPLKHKVPTNGFIFREKSKPKNIIKEAIKKYNIPLNKISGIKKGDDFIDENGNVILNSSITIPPMEPRSYAFCTDTMYDESIIPYIKGINILYHEATFMNRDLKRAKETNHSTAAQAAELAKKADVEKLIIGHFSTRYKDLSPLLEEARGIFPNTELAEEGNEYTIAARRKRLILI